MPFIGITELMRRKKAREEAAAQPECQKLIQPINRMEVGWGYKNKAYSRYMERTWGKPYKHYGADYWGENTIWSCGSGVVYDAGYDSTFGNIVIVKYPNCLNHVTGKVQNLVVSYRHLARINVRKGQKVTKDTRIGIMGHTGKFAGGKGHLHLQVHTDWDHPNWETGIYSTNMLRWCSYDSTINPADVLYTKRSAPDCQSVRTASGYDYTEGSPSSEWTFPII